MLLTAIRLNGAKSKGNVTALFTSPNPKDWENQFSMGPNSRNSIVPALLAMVVCVVRERAFCVSKFVSIIGNMVAYFISLPKDISVIPEREVKSPAALASAVKPLSPPNIVIPTPKAVAAEAAFAVFVTPYFLKKYPIKGTAMAGK